MKDGDGGREQMTGTRTEDDRSGGQGGWVTESGVEDRGQKTVAEDRRRGRGFGQKIYQRHLRYRVHKFHDGLAIPETLLKSVCLAKTLFL